jgi:hypothetical protein
MTTRYCRMMGFERISFEAASAVYGNGLHLECSLNWLPPSIEAPKALLRYYAKSQLNKLYLGVQQEEIPQSQDFAFRTLRNSLVDQDCNSVAC